MNDIVTYVLSIVLLIVICNFFVNKKPLDLPPGPWNLPILGSLLWLDPEAPHRSLQKFSEKYGSIFSLQLGKVYTVVICDARILKKILVKDEATGKAPLYIFNTLSKGRGLVFTQGNKWKQQRKFAINFLKSAGVSKTSPNRNLLQAQIMTNVDDFIQHVKNKGNRVVINPSEIFINNVASISTVLFLGKFRQREDEKLKVLLTNLEKGARLLGIAGLLNFLPFLRFLPQYHKNLKFLFDVHDKLYGTLYAIIKHTKNNMEGKQNVIQSVFQERIKTDLTDTEEQLCFLLIDLLGTSIETTTNSLLWIILYLTKYKNVQTKLRQELTEVLQGNEPTFDDLPSLPFMEATFAEVARIRTVAPLGIPHSLLKDMEIEGFRIPKGAMIMPFLWGIHMDPKMWEEPEEFRPQRFLDDNGCFHKPESFIPFQTGKRMCIGIELSRMIIFSFVSVILLNFEINSSDECEVDLTGTCGLTLLPNPQNVVFSKL